jgi:hypothetical protein
MMNGESNSVTTRFTVITPFFTNSNRSNIDRCQGLNDLRVVFTNRGETNRPNPLRRTIMRKCLKDIGHDRFVDVNELMPRGCTRNRGHGLDSTAQRPGTAQQRRGSLMTRTKFATCAAVIAALVGAAYTTAAYAVVPAQNKDTQTRCLIQGDGLNIRETPDLEGDLVAALEPSDTVIRHKIVTGREGRKWAYVEVPGDEGSSDAGYKGWVSYKYLTCQGSQPHEAQSPRPQRRRYYAPSPW